MTRTPIGTHRVTRTIAAALVALVLSAAPAAAQDDSVPARPSEPPPVGEAVDLGDVVVVDSTDQTRVLSEGGSATPFTIRLPQGATCPGDSANDDWRISTFLVPADDDLASLVMDVDTPRGDDQWVLATPLDVDDAGVAVGGANPFANELLLANPVPGQPGTILPFPEFDFSAYPAGTLTPGEWRVGAACSWRFVVTQYWDQAMTIEADAADEPAGIRWSVAPPSDEVVDALGAVDPSPSSGGGSNSTMWFVVAGVALLASVLFYILGSRREARAITDRAGA